MTILTHSDSIYLLKSEVDRLQEIIEKSHDKSGYNRDHENDSSIEFSLFKDREIISEEIERINNTISLLIDLG